MTERTKNILGTAVKEYILTGQPVGSRVLAEKYNFGISSATLRAELFALDEEGYLYQPHVSAGRVPTDRGYRFYTDGLRERQSSKTSFKKQEEKFRQLKQERHDLDYALAKFLAQATRTLAVAAAARSDIFYFFGASDFFRSLETEPEKIGKAATLLDCLEEDIYDLAENCGEDIEIFIGQENPLSFARDFTMITASYNFNDKEGLLAVIGPKRMRYDRNIAAMKFVREILDPDSAQS